jgi:hypothetical protein
MKNISSLKKLITEIQKQSSQEEDLEKIVDYLFDIDEDNTKEDMKEGKGRTSTIFKLKKDVSTEEVKTFLRRIQKMIETKNASGKAKGRNVKQNFTDSDIENFAKLLTKPEGFTRADILKTISFYQGKPFQYAQRLMDVLGDPKFSDKVDENGEYIKIGKGYIISTEDRQTTNYNQKKKSVPQDQEPDSEEIEFNVDLINDDDEDDELDEIRTLQIRAGIIK